MSEKVLSVPVSKAVFKEVRDNMRKQVFLGVCLHWFCELEAVLGHGQLEAAVTGTASKSFKSEFLVEGNEAGLCTLCEVFLTYGCGFPGAKDKEEKACFVLNIQKVMETGNCAGNKENAQNKVKEEKVC